jgi:hypothetical protein
MKRIYLIVIVIALFGLVVAVPSCSKKHSSSRPGVPGDTGTGTGTGTGGGGDVGTPTGDTVPGNIDIGLASSPEAPRYSGGGTAVEMMVAEDVNDFREENGLNRLAWNDEIADAERSHAYDCTQGGYFGHGARQAPLSHYYVQRGQFLKISGGSLYECALYECACWPSDPKYAVKPMWAESPGHRAALLNPTLKVHGVGISADGKYVMWSSLQ